MAMMVDHEARKQEILRKSLAIFAEFGYPGLTYAQLAKRCGLARTTLYKYFSSKREIFDGAINLTVTELAKDFRDAVERQPELSAAEKLELVLQKVVRLLFENSQLLQSITEYLMEQRRQGEEVNRKVRRHTMALRRTITQLLREGMEKGEFQEMRCDFIGDVLYGILEAAALRVAVTDTADFENMLKSCKVAIQALKK
jgi:AcrR family transcriptional regulator